MTTLLTGYFVAWLFWLQTALGCLGVLLISDTTGGKWGTVLRPYLWRASATLPYLALAFAPILMFMALLYPWARPETVAASELLTSRTSMMNPAFFVLRSIVYLATWIALAKFAAPRRSRTTSGAGLILLLFSASFAAMDWIMTLDTEWISTGFGVVFIAGCLINGFAFPTLMAIRREKSALIGNGANPILIDLGNLSFMAVLFWAYMNYMQYLIAWSGHIPRDMEWYEARSHGVWIWILIALVLFHFAIPFTALLFRSIKRDPLKMAALSITLLIFQFLEDLLLVAPSLKLGFWSSFISSVLWCAIVGIVWFTFYNRSKPEERPRARAGFALGAER